MRLSSLMTALCVLLTAPGGCSPNEPASAPNEPATPASTARPAHYKVEAVVTAVSAEWIPKEEAQQKAWLRINARSGLVAVDSKVKVKLFESGADPGRSRPTDYGQADRHLKMAPGKYDLQLTYTESPTASATGWIRGVTLEQGRLLHLVVTMDYAVGRLRVVPTSRQGDITNKTKVAVYQAGARKETRPITSFPSSREVILPSGTYDLLLSYEESRAVRVDQWLRGVVVPGKRALLTRRVPIRLDFTMIVVNVSNHGKRLDGRVRLQFYDTGADPRRGKPRLDTWSGRSSLLPAGRYDLKLSYDLPYANTKVWRKGLTIGAGRGMVTLNIDLRFALGQLRVTAKQAGRSLGGGAQVEVFTTGQHKRLQALLRTQRMVALAAGTYDIKVSHRGRTTWARGIELRQNGKVKKDVLLARPE